VYVVSVAANAVNFVAALGLIFGHWGLPALGLEGAAIATLIGQAAGVVILAAFFLGGHTRRLYDSRHQFRVHLRQILDLLRIGWPAGFQMSFDILGWALCITLLVGNIATIGGVPSPDAGTIQLTASTVAMRYEQLAFMPAIGISIAATALVGRYIGEKKPHLAQRRVYAALVLAVGYMGLCGLSFWFWRQGLIRFYLTLDQPSDAALVGQIVRVGGWVLIIGAIFQVFDATGIIFIGALRGAGDTLWPMVVSAVLNLSIILGGGYLMLHLFPRLESLGVWMACAAYVIILGVVMLARFRAGKWRRINLLA
jgi:MATE family multidrug resistance protein